MTLRYGGLSKPTSRRLLRLGSVSFLNAKPLIYGLERERDIDLSLDVPANLLEGLRDRRFDVALLPVIDYQRMAGLRILTSGGIGCDGPTLTVRIFSPCPIQDITTLACDTDSHTSAVLARLILAHRYNLRPEFVPLDRTHENPGAAMLLIGDKVVCEEPAGVPHQLDLGGAWKEWTGLPFVFAAWMAQSDVELGDLPARLHRASREGLEHVDELIERHAVPRGWPAQVAHRYLTRYLRFDIGAPQLEAIRLFHELAAREGIIQWPARALEVQSQGLSNG